MVVPTHANYLSTCLSILTSCHVTCDTRPSASLRVPNEAGRSGDEARLFPGVAEVTLMCIAMIVDIGYTVTFVWLPD